MDEMVRVEFDPPRQCEQVGKAWLLSAEGKDVVWLPTATTRDMEQTDGKMVAATVPRYIAEDRGLIVAGCPQESYSQEEQTNTMTREDWFTLGMAMALVIREKPAMNIPWEARKMAQKLLREDT